MRMFLRAAVIAGILSLAVSQAALGWTYGVFRQRLLLTPIP
jgi:hypothetical protein